MELLDTTFSLQLFRSLESLKLQLFRSLRGTSKVANCQIMVSHILQCIVALNCILKSHQSPLQTTYNLLLKEVLSFISNEMFNDDGRNNRIPGTTYDSDNDELVRSEWSPLHWAVLLCDKVGMKTVQDIYDADTSALVGRSNDSVSDSSSIASSAHVLCTSKESSKEQQLLLSDFIIQNPKAFMMNHDGLGVLHVLARYSNDVNLLETIIQLAPDEVSTKYQGNSPLDILIRGRFLESDHWLKMTECLLSVDNSPEVVHNAVYNCFVNISKNHRTYSSCDEVGELLRNKAFKFIEKVLNNCKAALNYQESRGNNLLDKLFKSLQLYLPASFTFDLMILLISIDKESVRQLSGLGEPLAYYAAQKSHLQCVSFLLDEYPEASTAVDSRGHNLLHVAMDNPSEEVVSYLCSRFPEMSIQYNYQGLTPLHYYLSYIRINLRLNVVSILCGCNPQVVKLPTLPCTTGTLYQRHLFPLYLFITKYLLQDYQFTLLSPRADIFRLLLRLYPAAANVKNEEGQTPYEMGVSRGIDIYFLRLLLRADTSINPEELIRLNYQARRMALLISSGVAVYGSTNKITIWRKLWLENKDMLRIVVSYL